MFQKVLSYVNQQHMLEQGEGIVAGVSGGVDSVCLLFVLRKIQETMGGSLYAAHINHGLRGAQADADEEFVRCLCEKWHIPFYLKRVDLRKLAQEKKITEEEAGRLVRYEFFRQTAEETGAAKIAVGHNANDNVETLLFHLMRGSGLKGLGGISPVQGMVIRPLLCVERKEIEKFAEEWNLDFCMDATNLEDTYTRNRIRHKLLPLMEDINPEVVGAIGRAAVTCRETAEFLEAAGKDAFLKFVIKDDGRQRMQIQKEAFVKLPPPVLRELLMQSLAAVSGSRKDIGRVHIEGLLGLQASGTGKFLCLPYGVRAENRYGTLLLYKVYKEKSDKEREKADKEKRCLAGKETEMYVAELALTEENSKGEIVLPDGGRICYKVENYEKNMKIPKNRYTKWLDCDIIKNTLHFRTRKAGDWIQVFANGGRKKLKEYLIHEKVPREERSKLILLAEGDEILWIPGYRMSEKVKVGEHTKRVLKLIYIGGNADETEK